MVWSDGETLLISWMLLCALLRKRSKSLRLTWPNDQSVACAGRSGQLQWGLTSQLTGHRGPATDGVRHHNTHLQGSSGVHALRVRSDLVAKRQYFNGGHNVLADPCNLNYNLKTVCSNNAKSIYTGIHARLTYTHAHTHHAWGKREFN